jgi:Holliday junction resolvase RusA-like endonuclease
MKKAIQHVLDEKKLKLSDIQLRCKEKPLGVKARFYLLKSTMDGDSKKDLDNLLKILFDVLSYDMIQDNKDEDLRGLGFMKDDEMVFEVRSSKSIVTTKDEMGFEISIYETSKK